MRGFIYQATDEEKVAFIVWLPIVDALRNQLSNASKEVINTIIIAQNQVKDGFLEANTYNP